MQDSLHDKGRLGFGNVLLAFVVFALTFGALLLWSVPGVDPSLWEELAVVTRLRPPQSVFPGFWRTVVGVSIHFLGLERTLALLPWVGHATGAASAALFYLILRQLLSFEIRTAKRYAVWSRFIAPFFSFVAAVLFGLSEPLSDASRTLTPQGVLLLLLLVIVYLTIRWLLCGGTARILFAHLLVGVLAAETSVAFLVPIVALVAYTAVYRKITEGQMTMPERFLVPRLVPRWNMFFLFLLGITVGIAVNLTVFTHFGGPVANGWRPGTALFHYGVRYWTAFCGAASPLGWMLAICFALVPFVLAFLIAPRVLGDDHHMSFGLGLVMIFVGAAAVMQTGLFPYARFWTFDVSRMSVESGFLLLVFVLCDFCALALVGAALAFECQGTDAAAEYERALEAAEDDEDSDAFGRPNERPPEVPELKVVGLAVKSLVPVVFVALAVGVAVRAPRPVKAAVQRIVDEAVEEIVEECGDANWLFTDGRLDPAVEFAAYRRGRRIRALNMMADSSRWSVAVRKRGFESCSNDCEAVATGVPVLFRTWAERTNAFDCAAFQFGFEYWQRERKGMPRLSGLVGRTKGLDEKAAAEGVVRVHALADRILATPEPRLNSGISSALYRAYAAVSWRIARLASLRDERDLADRLNESNGIMKRIVNAVERERQRTFMQLTPKEGLRLALRRTDFAEARRHAIVVLNEDADNLQANFAMAMNAISLNNLPEAETYLRKCHAIHPGEPAIVNNLSIVCRKLGKYDEALVFARKAAEMMPNAPEIRQSLKDAEKCAGKVPSQD